MASRRKSIEMTQEEIRSFLNAQPRLILVTNGREGYPHPMPVDFVVDEQGRFLVVTFRKSQKVKNLERDPRVGLLVETGLDYSELRAVVAEADAEIIDDVSEVIRVMESIFSRRNIVTGTESAYATSEKRVVLRLTPRSTLSWDHGKLGGKY